MLIYIREKDCVCAHAANVIYVIQEEKESNVLSWCEEKKIKDPIKYAYPYCRELKE